MKYEVTMPSLGADMDEGKFIEWKVKVEDKITKGMPIAVVETQKAAVEIESFRDGVMTKLIAKPDDIIKVGAVIAEMEIAEKAAVETQRVAITPAAKRKAEELKLDLSQIKGSGPGGAIELKDIEPKVAAAKRPDGVSLNIREAIAKRMSLSKKEIPHYYLKTRINLNALMAWLDRTNETAEPSQRIMAPAVFLKAVTKALVKHPNLNGTYESGTFRHSDEINLGVAIALKPDGVIVPALLGSQNLSLKEINHDLIDVAQRAREGGLKNSELTQATVTVTNAGDLGSDEVYGVIFPPQVAIIGIGRVRKEPLIESGAVSTGFVVDFTLSADHRVTDGIYGSRFLKTLEQTLQNPSQLEG